MSIRFLFKQAPQPPDPWTGVKDATIERASPYQKHFILNEIIGSEDCLYLNVYTRDVGEVTNLKPVMVWIYGGSFTSGSADEQFFGPQYLITQDIVLVTINYRVGILGKFYYDDYAKYNKEISNK